VLNELIDMCSLPGDTSEPNPAAQRILRSCRVISDIIEILRKPVDKTLQV